MIDHFSDDVIEKLNYYVYRLIDPRTGNTFYVGKGKGNRVFAHVNNALKSYSGENFEAPDDEEISTKTKQILEIKSEGLDVVHVIQRWGMDEKTAFAVEAAVIDCYPGLSNIQSGHDSDHGITNAATIENALSRKTYDEPDFKYMIIKTTPAHVESCADKEDAYYEATRSAWKVSEKKVKDYPYVFCVVLGVVKEVFKVYDWKPAINRPGRMEFEGCRAEEAIQNKFVGKRIPQKYIKKGMASPVLYSK